MRSVLSLALIAGLAVVACGKDQPSASKPAPEAEPPAAPAASDHAGRRVPIEVRKTGYVPSTLEAGPNEQLVLVFTRVEDTQCGRYIKLKGSSDKKELPLNQPVELPVTMPASGELVFTCGMDMMHGIVTVNPARG